MNSIYIQVRANQCFLDTLKGVKGLRLPDFDEANINCSGCANSGHMYEAGGVCVNCADEATERQLFPRLVRR